MDATQTVYGAEDLKAGFEVGLGFHLIVGRSLMLYAGYSVIPDGTKENRVEEMTIGLGLMF